MFTVPNVDKVADLQILNIVDMSFYRNSTLAVLWQTEDMCYRIRLRQFCSESALKAEPRQFSLASCVLYLNPTPAVLSYNNIYCSLPVDVSKHLMNSTDRVNQE